MIINTEVAEICRLVGIEPAKAPSRDPATVRRHVELFVRFVGYRAGLEAARQSRDGYDLHKEDSAILGDFLQGRLFERTQDHMDRSLFHGMRRLLALVEGATGYPMTQEATEKKALVFFLKAVLDDIKEIRREWGIAEPARETADEELRSYASQCGRLRSVS